MESPVGLPVHECKGAEQKHNRGFKAGALWIEIKKTLHSILINNFEHPLNFEIFIN